MISKNLLASFISKYSVNNRFENVKWRIENNVLTVYAGVSGRVCKVQLNNFPLDDVELGVWDTTKLSKLVSVTSGELLLSLETQNELPKKLHISDSSFDLAFSLADKFIIPSVKWYNDPDKWEVELELTREDVDNLIKSKNAFTEQEVFTMKVVKDLDNDIACEFTFGELGDYSSKINYSIKGNIDESILDRVYPFDATLFKDILNANKDQEECLFKFSSRGMKKISFKSDDIESIYYIAQKELN